jgi:NAD(P)-dependent dehydrogenase (short-subunit alcohol dehydrogenase family)
MNRSYVVTGGGSGIGRAADLAADAGGLAGWVNNAAVFQDAWLGAVPAAIEGLTRAPAVDYGPRGIRVNAVALGSVATQRYRTLLASQEPVVSHRSTLRT